ncbi:hypothetical protein QTG54_002621 [Skeletonema marinoi]|uniref:Uncharacterized protein n=1 Tax=Skeletonema marinoi TaxID=267567 RepID=A0AAD8YL43_9STRA|nr:hypothetical protein QTG54_002621 [Skeletonema marinoi]
MIHELKGSLERKCLFCRHPDPETQTQEEAARCARFAKMKRIEANDPTAMCDMGRSCYHEGDYKREGVEKDEKQLRHHLEQAAIGGHPDARYNLGIMEKEIERTKEQSIIGSSPPILDMMAH